MGRWRRTHQNRVGAHRTRMLIDDDAGVVPSRIGGGYLDRPELAIGLRGQCGKRLDRAVGRP